MIAAPQSHFKNELTPLTNRTVSRVFKGGRHGVRKLLVIVMDILATDGSDLGWVCFNTQSPTRDINFMHAIIARVAGSKVVPPMPGVMVTVFLKGQLGSRSKPCVVIETIGCIAGHFLADGWPKLDVPSPRDFHIADQAALEQFHGRLNKGRRSALRPVLYNFAGSRRSIN